MYIYIYIYVHIYIYGHIYIYICPYVHRLPVDVCAEIHHGHARRAPADHRLRGLAYARAPRDQSGRVGATKKASARPAWAAAALMHGKSEQSTSWSSEILIQW